MPQAVFLRSRTPVGGTPEEVLEATCRWAGYDGAIARDIAVALASTISFDEACNLMSGRVLALWRDRNNLDPS